MPNPQYQSVELLAFPANNDNGTNIGNTGRRRYTTSKLCNILCAENAKDSKSMDSAVARLIFDPSPNHVTGKYFGGLSIVWFQLLK
jgi:hypothetical protein